MTSAANVSPRRRLTYRADVDGLRAIAVLVVIGFHAAPGIVRGGFVGVDVFFVVSGFLITKLILADLDTSSFSFRQFYARRARRLFPALAIVLITLLVAGWYALLPQEYAQLGRHAAAGSLFASNILLWHEVNYFDIDAGFKPLLHLWSLGVEEQFYMVWPALVVALVAARRLAPQMIAAIGVTSFGLGLWLTPHHPMAAYYMPFSRLWELCLGAVLAMTPMRWQSAVCGASEGRRRRLIELVSRDAPAAIGIVLIVASALLLSQTIPYPGWRALPPTLGAALVVAAGPEAWSNKRLLSLRPIVFVGLISYSLYLWHWPLLSFIRIYGLPEEVGLNRVYKVVAVLASFGAAALTHAVVERPLRRRRLRPVALWSSAALALAAALGALVYSRQGIPSRLPVVRFLATAEQFTWIQPINETCLRRYPAFRQAWGICLQSRDGEPDVVIMGDSHANHLYAGLAAHPALRDVAFLQIGQIHLAARPDSGPSAMRQELRYLYVLLDSLPNVRYVVLSSRWPVFDSLGRKLETDSASSRLAQEGPHPGSWENSDLGSYMQGIRYHITQLEQKGVHVILMLETPRLDYDPRLCFSRPFRDATRTCVTTRDAQLDRQYVVRQALRDVVRRHPETLVFDALDAFCQDATCDLAPGGTPMLRDGDHLSRAGSARLANRFVLWARHSAPDLFEAGQRRAVPRTK